MKFVISGIFLFGLLAFVSTLDEDSLKEQNCRKDLPTAELNTTWYSSVRRWHIPYVSKLKAYRFYSDILDKDIKDLTLEEIQNSCLHVKHIPNPTVPTIYAFNLKDKVKVDADPLTNIHFEGQHKNHSAVGDMQMTMTDNASYIVVFTCWSDNELTWEIATVKPTIEPEIKAKIFEFVKAFGFKVDDDTFYEEISYDKCNLD